MKNDPTLLIQAMLTEEDDIFKTLLCRAAKCAAGVWEHLPHNIRQEIRDRIAASWTQWMNIESEIDLSAVATLAIVDGLFLDKIIDGLKAESTYVEYVTALFLAKKVTCIRVTEELLNFLGKEKIHIDEKGAAAFRAGDDVDRLSKMIEKLADPMSVWNVLDDRGARFCDRVAMSRPQVVWPRNEAWEGYKKLKREVETAERDSIEGIYEQVRLHPYERPLWTLLKSTCKRLGVRLYADGRIRHA